MKTLFICPKERGNTYRVFSYIADSSSDVRALSKKDSIIDIHKLHEYDRIIFGSGVYGGNLHKKLKDFMSSLKREDLKRSCKIYLFLTWFGRSDSNKQVFNQAAGILDDNGLILENNTASCFGAGFGVVRVGHPNTADLETASKWFKSL